MSFILANISYWELHRFQNKVADIWWIFSNYNSSECGHVLEQNDIFMESDWSKKAHDRPCSLLFSFYLLKIGSIVAPSESMKFPILI